MSVILKFKALIDGAGRLLRGASARPSPVLPRGASDLAKRPATEYRGTAFAPHDVALNPGLSGSDWRPSPLVQPQSSFAQQCTLQAVFDWYRDFVDREIDHRISDSSDDDSANYPHLLTSRQTQGVPGFPQFARQTVDTEVDAVRVRFYHPDGREAGVLLLRADADRCTIEVPGGSLFVVRETTVLADLTSDLS